jgi:hypothetical protein
MRLSRESERACNLRAIASLPRGPFRAHTMGVHRAQPGSSDTLGDDEVTLAKNATLWSKMTLQIGGTPEGLEAPPAATI